MKRVYLAGPIENLSWTETSDWRVRSEMILLDNQILPINPLRGKMILTGTKKIESDGKFFPKEIVGRDRNDVTSCDVVLMNLHGINNYYIGTFVELGWADMLRIPVVIVLDKDNEKRKHPFIQELSYAIVETLDEAIDKVLEILK